MRSFDAERQHTPCGRVPSAPERPDRPGDGTDRPPRTQRTAAPRRSVPREERPEPEPQEILSPKLYVGNLAYEAGESDLFDLFSKVGAVKNVEVAMDRRSNRSKGFGFVEMEVLETAKEAAEKLNRTDFMGRQIVVSGAKMERRQCQPAGGIGRQRQHALLVGREQHLVFAPANEKPAAARSSGFFVYIGSRRSPSAGPS